MLAHHFTLPDETHTDALGRALGQALHGLYTQVQAHGAVLTLSGDLGAGKTALVRALLRALGVTGPVKSPTFSLLEPYDLSSLNFYHFDFYRFGGGDEFATAGFRELFAPGTVCAVEWPERAGARMPTPDLSLTFKVMDQERVVQAMAHSPLGTAWLTQAIATMQHRTATGDG
ncbi:MAG: tRNA (adenosine(37)-N6)-threonylcarbamoyltransferase complex ATPase subunit type 1 TsaE [Burkholderiales bacterium]|jgi:tRNA threonylcarbamoyladenosine biosynthesis protein TsaE|nr:tRNA (adenosine(37)-N6)-threonylcarbamoyltransferase complex ATPase subunit type 1 TsaE [Burkholderiales bacterium]